MALAVATNIRSLLRLLTAPFWIGLVFFVVAILTTSYDAWKHIAGLGSHPLPTTLSSHLLEEFLKAFRRVVTLFAASTSVWILVVTVSASDLRRVHFLPRSWIPHIELFFSCFSRFQESALRVAYAHRQNAVRHRRVDYLKIRSNPLRSLWAGLVVFVVIIAAQVPSIWNLREMRRRILTGGRNP